MTLNLTTARAELDLATGDIRALDGAAGTSIRAKCGTIWVTEEGDSTDFILSPGERRVVAGTGRTLVQAMRPAHVSIREAAAAQEPVVAAPTLPLEHIRPYKPIEEFLFDVRLKMFAGS